MSTAKRPVQAPMTQAPTPPAPEWEELGEEKVAPNSELVMADPKQLPQSALDLVRAENNDLDFLFQGGQPRLGLNELKSALRFSDGEEVPHVIFMVNGGQPVYSHKNPTATEERNGAKVHLGTQDWCETRNNHETSTEGFVCKGSEEFHTPACPAYEKCKGKGYKIELQIAVPNRDPGEYLFTLPLVSSINYKGAVQAIATRYQLGPRQVTWMVHVESRRNSDDQPYPVMVFEAYSQEGEPLDTSPVKAEPPKPRVMPVPGSRAPAARR